ncbi:ATP-citrate lyase beta-subunit [Nitratiruptor sp. YY08-26]|uniref:ATP citrate lyase citrate-binding domain-containing protein n=1 Tax=unclassified Nitratiruptor TaxID=2624044 RepID=UPI001915F2AA|nr:MULTISPECIES: ATP citrate lyase citrate-binding domain-containing protein [unclassified Nitratiruptor]BCD61894.1 ATP-citrate lyase beta-subunit [Nitratiruptor sp. YY08-13]BCD65829.1 ATP-citrate lyase beta-subunit [Nitratiruptor sp. YY08-26]
MAQRAIREYDGKKLFAQNWDKYFAPLKYPFESVLVTSGEELKKKAEEQGYEWLKNKPLVAKPDMLFGKRGKNNLVLFKVNKPGDVTLEDAAKWIDEKRNQETTLLSGQKGVLTHFIVEPFTPHTEDEEYYIAATTLDENYDVLYMSAHGGMEVEENWDKVVEVKIPINASDEEIEKIIKENIPADIPEDKKETYANFAVNFYKFFRDLNFAYLEINPVVIVGDNVYLLDLVARLDDTAGFLMRDKWGDIEFPTPFGMPEKSPEEKAIAEADAKSGASLKLTVLNPEGRIWTLVAGGGASVVYADTIADLAGGVEDLANYGEYSGGPTTDETRFYTETVLDLMTRKKDPQGRDKILIIGGAIANFTDVAKTFTGIIQAFEKYADKMKDVGVRIYVRRGGPNYEKGLKDIKEAAERLGLPIKVFGPETHITDIVRMAIEEDKAKA